MQTGPGVRHVRHETITILSVVPIRASNCISLNDEMKKNILKVVSSQDEKVHTHVNRDMTYHVFVYIIL